MARTVVPLEGTARDWDPLLARIGDARFVLLGEATHGTHEFYRERARLTRRLVEERGFDALAIEADWPDAYRVNRFIAGTGEDRTAEEALRGFTRFPAWMWRNRDVLDLVTWLRRYNDAERGRKVSLFGLDLYSLHASIDAIVRDLGRIDPAAAAHAREAYKCFEPFGGEPHAYGYTPGLAFDDSCERAASEQLRAIVERAKHDGDDFFSIQQNARVVQSAERYYRRMFRGGADTWNLRDRHMADTLSEIAQELDRRLGRPSRVVVWEHNSHLGDARATQMSEEGELNVGQLVRERYGRDAFLVGFTTYEGTVTAAKEWDGPATVRRVRPALEGSFEAILHGLDERQLLLVPDEERRLPRALRHERLERAIGVVYRPETERTSHWFRARLADQFDAVLHVDRSTAVVPLEPEGGASPEPPETYPYAL